MGDDIINPRKVCDDWNLPEDVMLGTPIIEMIGNHSIYIENYKMICNISEENMVVKCKNYFLVISGNGLTIKDYNKKTSMIIIGVIDEVSFCRNLH